MQIEVVNARNEKVGSLDLRDEVFGGRVKADVIWQAVVHEQASRRRGTHATKTRADVAGSGRKPWRQKGTGRARVGEIRNPLWRKGGTVFGPQPRDYGYALPKKVARGALRAALAAKLQDGVVTVVEALAAEAVKTKTAAATLKGLGATGRTLLVDVHPDDNFALSVRNIARVRLVPSNRVTARDVMDARRVILTRAAMERLQEVLA
jgi:large subunit ribosomal protein L4